MDSIPNNLYNMHNSGFSDSSIDTNCPKCLDLHPATFNCGSGFTGPLPATVTTPSSVASVNSNLKKFKNPKILITFTGIISLPATITAAANISFQLVKSCYGTSQVIGGSYNYSDYTDGVSAKSNSFAFQVCDCGCCCDCVTYTVQIANTTNTAGVMVSGTVSAVTVDSCCSSCC